MITKSDTPNGRHLVETVSQQPMEESHTAGKSSPDSELERPSPPEEQSHNGVTSMEENTSSLQEADLTLMKETDVKEVKESKLDQTKAETDTTPPPPTVTSASSLPPPPPPPPSLVQSSDLHDEPRNENKATVRTAPPALVGCETLDKEASEERPEDEEEIELNDGQARSVDSTQLVGEGSHIKQDEGSSDIDDSAQQQLQRREEEVEHQQHDVSEESPGLVIDMGSQPGTEDEIAPAHVVGKPEMEEHGKNKHIAVNSATDSSQVSSYEGLKGGQPAEPSSPQSITSNEEDVELEMDIIEEGEEDPPPLPPPIPRGTLMKAPTASVTSTLSQAHIQTLSSAHPRIGVSPSHTANRLALENLKNRDSVRKPNVIVSSPSSSGSSVVDLSRNGNSVKEGGGNDPGRDRQSVVTDNFRVRQVAKVKQFFTALQQFSNKRGSEVAEQVQELITAVVVSSFLLVCIPHPLQFTVLVKSYS